MCGTSQSREDQGFDEDNYSLKPARETDLEYESSAFSHRMDKISNRVYSDFTDTGFRFFNQANIFTDNVKKIQNETYYPKWSEFTIHPLVLSTESRQVELYSEGNQAISDLTRESGRADAQVQSQVQPKRRNPKHSQQND